MDKEYLERSISSLRKVLTLSEAAIEDIEIATGLKEKKDPIKDLQDLFPKVRELATTRSREGHTEEVRALITKLGYQKLSEIPCGYYKDLIKSLEEMK